MTQDNHKKFIQLEKNYQQIIKFYNLEEICPDKISELNQMILTVNQTGTRTVGNLYRMLIHYVIPKDLNKIIFSDSDIITNLDINELWQTDVKKFPLAAVPEVKSYVNTGIHAPVKRNIVVKENYFNAGLLVINLDKWRNESDKIIEGIKFVLSNPDCDCADQDMLNYSFSKNYVKLPKKFNTLVEYARMYNDFETGDRICHYITSSHGKGFGLDTDDAFNKLFLKYFIKSPWFNEESIGRLYNQIVELYNGRQNFATQISALMSGKTRAFFVTPQNIDAVRKIFYINPNEEIIPAETVASLEKMFVSLRNSEGKKIFFILVDGYPAIREFLMKAGFIEGRDFINGMAFLSNAHGVNMNPFPLVKAM